MAAEAVGRQPAEAIVIGDAIGTDLAGAKAVGARCILMLTGITTRDEVDALPADRRPDQVAANAEELAAALESISGFSPSAPAHSRPMRRTRRATG
jgi:ribonucleotide monophosphatase NagD (HAD superfamily)